MMWRKIRVTVCHRLHQRRAILANRDIQRDMFPLIPWPMTELSPDLGEFTEVLDDVSVEMIPVRYR